MATRDDLVAWLRREAHRIDTIRERVGRAAEGPGWEDSRYRDSRRHRQTLYQLADRLDAAHEATLEALDMFDPEWDDKPEPIHDHPAPPISVAYDFGEGPCLCDQDPDEGRIILNSACPIHVGEARARADYVRGKLHGCLCAWDDDLGIHTVASTCPFHGVEAAGDRNPFRGASRRGDPIDRRGRGG